MGIHVRGNSGEVAETVLLPGDPDRATVIAESFLEDVICYTSYRRMYGYTGYYRGQRVSVQATGMGGPSAAIVCEELLGLGAKFFIRVGTCGAMQAGMGHGDLVLAQGVCAMDGVPAQIFGGPGFSPLSDFEFLRRCCSTAESSGIRYHVGNVASMDLFYSPDLSVYEKLKSYGILAVEMEASTVLTIAARSGVKGAAVFTVSDVIEGEVRASEDVIESGVVRMLETVLQSL